MSKTYKLAATELLKYYFFCPKYIPSEWWDNRTNFDGINHQLINFLKTKNFYDPITF